LKKAGKTALSSVGVEVASNVMDCQPERSQRAAASGACALTAYSMKTVKDECCGQVGGSDRLK